MSNSTKPATKPTSPQNVSKTEATPTSQQARQQFFAAALNMSWQMALAVLIPVFIGAWLDDHFDTKPTFIFVGLIAAIIASTLVLRAQLQKVTPREGDK